MHTVLIYTLEEKMSGDNFYDIFYYSSTARLRELKKHLLLTKKLLEVTNDYVVQRNTLKKSKD